MKFKKIIDGIVVIKSQEDIIVRTAEMQIINPSKEEIIFDGWQEYIIPSVAPNLEDVIHAKIAEILAYDSSEAVNEFSMSGVAMWLDKATRAGLLLRFEAETKAERETTTLWYGGQSYTLPLAQAQQILIALELYASGCYDRTQAHIAEVQKLESKEAVEAYDYTTGYPSKLSF